MVKRIGKESEKKRTEEKRHVGRKNCQRETTRLGNFICRPTKAILYHLESFDHAVDEQAQGPSQIYDLPEETGNCMTQKIPGRVQCENLEGVQSKQADKTAPEKYDREIPRKTGDDNPKRVSYELENGNAELDYLIILPAVLNYEQPVYEPVPDA